MFWHLITDYLLASYMGILNEGQGRLQAFQLSHSIRVSDKLLYQSKILPPLWTLLILYPLEQLQSFFITIQTGFPHLKERKNHMEKGQEQKEKGVYKVESVRQNQKKREN